MKKLTILLIALLTLTSCFGSEDTPYSLRKDDSFSTYQYKISSQEEPLTLTIPLLKSNDEEVTPSTMPIYSLNPIVEYKDGRGLNNSTFYKSDDVDTFTKDRIYNFAYYGFGFWYLNDSGVSKSESGSLLNKNDYALLFGDFYHNTDFNNQDYIKYYLATQELIWETIVNPETGNPYQVEFIDVDINKEKQQILDAQAEYGKVPFFNGSVINVSAEDLASPEPYQLTDTNGVLSRYTIRTSEDVELLPHEDPNVLTFNLKGVDRNTKIDFIPQFKINQEFSQVYSSNDNVSYVSIGQERATNMISNLHFEKQTAANSINLVITTYDDDTKVEIYGAQYQVSTGPEFLTPSTTTVAEEGLPALLENLVPGTYYIQQIVAPEGYALNQQVEEISISGGIMEMTYPVYNKKLDQ